jgi:hypothetical protein
MKLLNSKKMRVVATAMTIFAVIGGGTAALASIGGGQIFADIINQQKQNLFGLIPPELSSYVGQNGQINLNNTLKDVSKQALDMVGIKKSPVKTAGDQASDIQQDVAEIAQQANTKSTGEGVKLFEDNASRVEQVASQNETNSDSSLEAADKSNKMQSTLITTNQQLTKATLDLATAQQNSNAIEIQKGQERRSQRLKDQIDVAYTDNESERIQAVARRRFYPDAAGEMVEGTSNSATKAFSK